MILYFLGRIDQLVSRGLMFNDQSTFNLQEKGQIVYLKLVDQEFRPTKNEFSKYLPIVFERLQIKEDMKGKLEEMLKIPPEVIDDALLKLQNEK